MNRSFVIIYTSFSSWKFIIEIIYYYYYNINNNNNSNYQVLNFINRTNKKNNIDLINFLRIFFVFKKGNGKLEYMKRTTFSINMVGNEKQKLGKHTIFQSDDAA